MKPKFKINETVRIKKTGEKGNIMSIYPTHSKPFTIILTNRISIFNESEIAHFRPSRTGKYRNAKGQFMSKESNMCSWCDTWFHDIGKHLMTCPMRKAAQEQREHFSWTDVSDSKQRNYKKIEKMDEQWYNKDCWGFRVEKKINEIIDELWRRV